MLVISAGVKSIFLAGWYTYELPIGFSGTCYIILRGESQYCTATYMDNFMVQEIPVSTVTQTIELVEGWNDISIYLEVGEDPVAMLDLLKAVDGRIPNFAGIKYTFESLYEYNQCRLYKGGKFDASNWPLTVNGLLGPVTFRQEGD